MTCPGSRRGVLLPEESALRMFVRRHPALYRAAHYPRRRTSPRLPDWWPSKPVSLDAAILDVGSGVGRLLLLLKSLGYRNLVGVDPFIAEDIRIRNGPAIFTRSIEEIDGQFEVVIMNHALEHIADSRRVFGELKRLLASSGLAVIRTPLASSLAWREYGSDWVELDAPRHLVVHTLDSIAALAEASAASLEAVTHSDTSVLTPLTIDVMVPRGVTLAALKGVSQGQVTVGAVGGPLCSPGQVCPAYLVVYSLRVTVVPG